jgi:hypothetical protein
MTLRDELLPVIEEAYALVDELGLRTIRVWVRAQSSDQPFNTAGTITASDTELTPRPRVVQTPEQPGWSGGAIAPAYDGRAARRRFTVGPIVRSHSVGGYKVADLFSVAATASDRALVMLADEGADVGGELGTTPVAFKVERVTVRQFGLVLDVVEADEVT